MLATIIFCFMFAVCFSFVAAICEVEYESWMHKRGYYHQDARWIRYK